MTAPPSGWKLQIQVGPWTVGSFNHSGSGELGFSQVVLVVKKPPTNAGDNRLGFDVWVGRSPEEGMATHSSVFA